MSAPSTRLTLRAGLIGGVLGLALALYACGDSSQCGPANCSGCCTAEGRCDPGTIPQACGFNGAACQACGPLDLCSGGVCIPTSNPNGHDGGTHDKPDAGPDAGPQQQDAGVDAGFDAGFDAGTDAGVPTSWTLAQLRQQKPVGQHVRVTNVVVHDVFFSATGTAGDVRADFWVVDAANPRAGIWVEKFYTDPPTTWSPQVGDKLQIDGWYGYNAPTDDREGYRQSLRSEYAFGGSGLLQVTLLGTATPPVNASVSAGPFGNAFGGQVQANPEYAGTRVHINGPLTLTNAHPTALERINAGSVVGYNGFEVTGGILVNDYKTYQSCDYRGLANDGGTVVFPNGISGVWDSYTHAPCLDTAVPCNRQNGFIPGVGTQYTYVLYPLSCADLQ